MSNVLKITNLPSSPSTESDQQPPNPARAVQSFVGEVMSIATKPVDCIEVRSTNPSQQAFHA
jgi:hypothetical protein